MISGFVAGTLVHTISGLAPIEKIRVGDFVLSKPESGDGEVTYKRVSKTFVGDDKEVWYVGFERRGIAAAPLEERVGFVVVTSNHPFFVVAVQEWAIDVYGDLRNEWVRADRLFFGAIIQLADGQQVEVARSERILRTARPSVGFLPFRIEHMPELEGCMVDLGGAEPDAYPCMGLGGPGDGLIPNDLQGWEFQDEEQLIFRQRVHTLEIAETHTYFVHRFGVWVLNAACS